MLIQTMKLLFYVPKLATFTQMEMLRREFTELREEVMAAKCLMDSVREMVMKLLSKLSSDL